MAYLKEHQEDCMQAGLGHYTHVHLFLDQFSASYKSSLRPHINRSGQGAHGLPGSEPHRYYHRLVLHHQGGIDLVRALFGENAAKAARIHIAKDAQHGWTCIEPGSAAWQQELKKLRVPVKARLRIADDYQRLQKLQGKFSLMIPDEVPGSLSPQAITKLEGKLPEAGLVLLAGTSGGQAAEPAGRNRELLVKASPWAIDLVALGDEDRALPIEVFGTALYLAPPQEPSAGAVVLENSDQSGPSVQQVGGVIFVRPGTCAPGAASIPSIIRVDLSPNPPRCTCAIMQWDEGSGAWSEQPDASS